MAGQLAKKIRDKYPGEYDDMTDEELEKAVLAKYPEYADLVEEPISPTEPIPVDTQEFNQPIEEPVEEPEGDLARLVAGLPIKKKESGISQFFDTINEPITKKMGTIPQEARDLFAQEHPYINMVGSFAENLLTPLNLGTGGLLGTGRAIGSKLLWNLGRGASGLTAASGVENLTDAESYPQGAAAILEIIGGLAGARGKLPTRIPEVLPPEPPVIRGELPAPRRFIADEGGQVIDLAPAAGTPRPKLKVVQTPEGDLVNPDTGDTIIKVPKGLKVTLPPTETRPVALDDIRQPVAKPIDLDPDILDLNQRTAAQERAVAIANKPEMTGNMPRTDLHKMLQNPLPREIDPKILEDIRKNGIKPIQVKLQRSGVNPKTEAGMDLSVYGDDYGVNGQFVIDNASDGPQILAAAKKLGIEEIPIKIVGKIPESIPIEGIGPFSKLYDPKSGKRIPPPPIKPPVATAPVTPQPTGLPKIDTKQASPISDVLNVPRAVKASIDFSFPFRQGLGMIHTKSWWQSWSKSAKAYGSQKAFDSQMAEILERPNHKPTMIGDKPVPSFSEQAGLKLADINDISKREENNMSQLAEKIPILGRGVRASTRAHTAFANKLRADNFDRMIANMEKAAGSDTNLNPRQNIALAKQVAEYVNAATGRGSLGAAEKYATGLNAAFFSPRLIASRLQMLNPVNYTATAPPVRKEYLKSMLAMAATWQGMIEMGKLAGAEVVMDTTSSDFGKLKFGDTRIDPAGGLQQYLVLLNKMAEWGRTSTMDNKHKKYGEGFNAPTFGEDFGRFLQNKLAPIPNLAVRAAFATTNRKSANPPLELGDEAIRLITPIVIEDLSEILQEDPELWWTLIPSSVGMGTQTYGKEVKSTRLLGDAFPRDRDFIFPAKRR